MSSSKISFKNVLTTWFLGRKQYVILIAVIGFYVVYLLYTSWSSYVTTFNPSLYEDMYKDFISGGFMSDADFYAYVGWRYICGVDPFELTATWSPWHPPLSLYMIGLSIIVFKNQNVLGLVFGVLTLICVYLVSRRIIGGSLFIFLPIYILCLDKMFVDFSALSMLDIYVMFFVVLSVLLYLKAIENPKLIIVFMIVLGLALASKWIAGFLLPAFIAHLVLRRDWRMLKYLMLSLPIAVAVYTLTWSAVFLHGHTLQDYVWLHFEGVMDQILRRYPQVADEVGKAPFWILLYLLTGISGPGTRQTIVVSTTGEIITRGEVEYGLHMLPYYNPFTWPLTFSASILTLYYAWKSKELNQLFPSLWFFSFIAFLLNMGSIFEWYLLPILPAGYIALTYMIKGIYSSVGRKNIVRVVLAIYLVLVAIWSLLIEIPEFIRL